MKEKSQCAESVGELEPRNSTFGAAGINSQNEVDSADLISSMMVLIQEVQEWNRYSRTLVQSVDAAMSRAKRRGRLLLIFSALNLTIGLLVTAEVVHIASGL
jgi:hypothetical protein